MKGNKELRDAISRMTDEQRTAFFNSLSPSELESLKLFPELFLFEKQLAPPGKWRYHLYMAGRGSGKSYASMAWLYSKYLNGAKSLAMVGPDYGTVVNVLVPMFLDWFPEKDRPQYNSNLKRIDLPKGAVVYVHSADTEIRGGSYDYVACDEICKWCDSLPDKIANAFDILDFSCRSTRIDNPQIFISSTPKPFPFFVDFVKRAQGGDELFSLRTGSTDDNRHLSDSFRKAIHNRHDGTRIGRQEISGELLLDTPGALWTYDLIDRNRITPAAFGKVKLRRTVVAIDPAVTSNQKSDETGIIVGAVDFEGKVYILRDGSGKMTPLAWSQKAAALFKEYSADRIVAEKNNGGELVAITLQTAYKNAPIKLVSASKGKIARAEPIASLYERNRVHHVGVFKELEAQLTSYTGDQRMKSPDRLDALVWCVTELLLSNTTSSRHTQTIGYY